MRTGQVDICVGKYIDRTVNPMDKYQEKNLSDPALPNFISFPLQFHESGT